MHSVICTKCIWQKMTLDATEAIMRRLLLKKQLHIKMRRHIQHFSECKTAASSTNNREELPLNGGSGCWIYHALNMTSFNLKYTSPLIASASLTRAFNQTLWEQFPGQTLSSIFPQLFGVLILRSTQHPIGFASPDLLSCLKRQKDTLFSCTLCSTRIPYLLFYY